jgi:hypothetical protein
VISSASGGGGGAYAEDEWSKIRINGQVLSSVGPCNRCTMICIDRDTAKFQKEPLLTLSSYRRDSKVDLHFSSFLLLHTFFVSTLSQSLTSSFTLFLLMMRVLGSYFVWATSHS